MIDKLAKGNAVVVGGGISGLLAAFLLSKQGLRVSLIEQAPELGGLLRSVRSEPGDFFDMGTHLVRGTGVELIDEFFLHGIDDETWRKINPVVSGSFSFDSLNTQSPFIDASLLAKDLYCKGEAELLEAGGESTAGSADLYLKEMFGETFASRAIIPALEKFYGCSAALLSPNAHELFGLNRILIADADRTKILKKEPRYDKKIGFRERSSAVNSFASYYPQKQGIGLWVRQLQSQLESLGVRILNNCSIASFERSDDKIISATLSNGEQLKVDHLVWSVPAFLLLKTLGIASVGERPKLRSTTLFNFVFDTPPSTELMYFSCFNPNYKSFRVTMYSNLRAPEEGRYSCTVEVLHDPVDQAKITESMGEIAEELFSMGVFPREAKTVYSQALPIGPGFPVMTPQFIATSREHSKLCSAAASNIYLCGKASGSTFFMHDVLLETHNVLKPILAG
jgi:protoporphyrinogen oxidase